MSLQAGSHRATEPNTLRLELGYGLDLTDESRARSIRSDRSRRRRSRITFRIRLINGSSAPVLRRAAAAFAAGRADARARPGTR